MNKLEKDHTKLIALLSKLEKTNYCNYDKLSQKEIIKIDRLYDKIVDIEEGIVTIYEQIDKALCSWSDMDE